jgi:hypothetical protein
MGCLHTVPWWRGHWERGGVLDVEVADTMPGAGGSGAIESCGAFPSDVRSAAEADSDQPGGLRRARVLAAQHSVRAERGFRIGLIATIL